MEVPPIVHFLVIGHLTRDVIPDGHRIGGSVTYAGILAHRLGAKVTILTRAHPDDVAHPGFEGIDVINLPSKYTSTFENIYNDQVRVQYLRAVAGPIMVDDVPEACFDADITLLAPLTQEIDPAIVPRMKGLVAASPQGWMREWDAQGKVRAIPWYSAGRILPYLDAIVFSDADIIADTSILLSILESVPSVAVTHDEAGSVVYVDGKARHIAPRPTDVVDVTGAGDVFTAAFLLHLYQHGDIVQAAYFANVAASFSIEAAGVEGIPTRDRIEEYIRNHPLP